MSHSACTITSIEQHHNPNEGRIIINNNFECLFNTISDLGPITGGTTPSLSEVLAIGNETGVYNIEISDGYVIQSSNLDATLNLSDPNGPNGTWSITSDNGSFSSGSTWVYGQPGNGSQLAYQRSASEAIGIGIFSSNISTPLLNTGKEILIFDNTGGLSKSSGDFDKRAVLIGTKNSTFNNNVINSVIIGGSGITASSDNTVYVPYLNIKNVDAGSPLYNLGIDSNGNVVTGSSSASYSEYRANLTQSSTNAPVATTLGTPTLSGGLWSYSSIGSYFFTKTGAFSAASNVEVEISNAQVYAFTMSNSAFSLISAAVYDDDRIEVRTSFWGSYPTSAATFNVITPGLAGTSVIDAMSDDILSNTRFCVRVWS